MRHLPNSSWKGRQHALLFYKMYGHHVSVMHMLCRGSMPGSDSYPHLIHTHRTILLLQLYVAILLRLIHSDVKFIFEVFNSRVDAIFVELFHQYSDKYLFRT